MFLKRFKRTHDAGRYFNQANEYWREAKQYVLEGKQKCADDSLVEVIRCCQLAIECDERMGDAYILLSNALMNLANQMSEQAESAQHEFLLSRAAAVIHFWHSLPYRNYPISKNAKIGEQLWRKVIQEIMQKKSMSESTALSSLDSYRDSLAAETISPKSVEKIKRIIFETKSAQDTESPWLQEPLEETLSPETRHFITKILPEVIQRRAHKEQVPEDRLFRREKLVDSLKYEGKIGIANIEIMERIQKAFNNNNFREVTGWITWLFLLQELRQKVMLDSDKERDLMAKQSGTLLEMLKTTSYRARQAEDWETLLLVASFCEWVDLPKWRDEVLKTVHDHIDEQLVAKRLLHIKRQPQMLIEDAMVNRLQRYLGLMNH